MSENLEQSIEVVSPAGSAFPTTQWSMIMRAGNGSESQVRSALETLCRQYWYPLYGFARRQGRDHHEAEDATQGFLLQLLSTDGIARACPERGRFRTFLLTSYKNFLTNEWRRGRAAKRGNGLPILSLEFGKAGDRFSTEPIDTGLTPEQAFDRTWARELIDRAIADLRQDYEKNGRALQFTSLLPLLWDKAGQMPQAELASRLGMNTHALTMALHRLRQRLGQRLRAIVAETVVGEAETDAELRLLIAALGEKNS